MGILAPALAILLIGLPQETEPLADRPKVTLEKTGDFHALVGELAKQLGIQIKIQEEVSKKEVKASLRDAGLFEALDALCKAHGKVTYFRAGATHHGEEESTLELEAGEWREYPVHYTGHYKTIVSHVMRVRQLSSRGEESGVQVELCTFAPPWHELEFPSGFTMWRISSAVAHDGRPALGGIANSPGLMSLNASSNIPGNVSTWNVGLKDFDPSLGLRELGGKAIGTIAAYKVVRVPLEAGKSVDIPGGTLVVDSVTAVDKEDEEDRWRIVFTLKPSEEGGKRPSERILERRVRFDGEEVWSYAMYSGRGPTYEIDSRYLKAAPAWMEFRVKSGERKVEAPFKFTDLKWIEK